MDNKITIQQAKSRAATLGNEVLNAINSNSSVRAQETITRICQTTALMNYPFAEPIVDFFKSSKNFIYGKNWEERAKGKVHFTEWTPKSSQEKSITPACAKNGKTVTVNTKDCCSCGDCQVPQDFSFILQKKQTQLCAYVDEDEIRSLACGADVYNALLSLTNDQITTARNELPYDCMLNLFNDPSKYSKPEGVTLSYCCDKCDGKNLIQAIRSLSKKLRTDASEYNIDGRIYRLPVSQQVLIVSDDLDDRIASILGNTYNTEFNNIRGDFAAYFNMPLTIADFIIVDRNWLRFAEGLNRVRTRDDEKGRGYCVFADYDYGLDGVSFRAAVFGKLNKIDCTTEQGVNQYIQKIQIDNTEIEANTQPEAEAAIKTRVDSLNPDPTNILTTYTYSDFKAPTDDTNGNLTVDVVMKDKLGNELGSVSKTYVLVKKN